MHDDNLIEGEKAEPAWARLLFGEDPWPMLLAMLACGMLVYLLAREAVPAILAVVVTALAAHAWLLRRDESAAEKQEPP
ncbi:MAG TPA: hypothetical protein PLW81_07705 [Thiobacillaceae bacterium]|nr:hypothetical protein [Thiobacillaceae bacterium]